MQYGHRVAWRSSVQRRFGGHNGGIPKGLDVGSRDGWPSASQPPPCEHQNSKMMQGMKWDEVGKSLAVRQKRFLTQWSGLGGPGSSRKPSDRGPIS